ncbi:DUF3303 family protein [Streptomyces purpureus]|uniref:Uncharacterized protein n=1 Tax=Streptomyces purpureus TaxID=1951 RepID=A0A918HIV7_9ACTN|nr:DUF3303 family protein [Streptomyces purpureus]GGT67096.1 hypothetical protein GCM10014713_69490 [Streptomyces purpureus]
MRVLLHAHVDTESGNEAIRNGKMPELMKSVMEQLKPEAAYFFPSMGRRSCIFVFDMPDPSQLPVVSEKFFMELGAEVEVVPVMNADDLKKGLQTLQSRQG